VSRRQKRPQARAGAPDAALAANAALAAVTELCGRVGVIEAADGAAGPVQQRNRGFSSGRAARCGGAFGAAGLQLHSMRS